MSDMQEEKQEIVMEEPQEKMIFNRVIIFIGSKLAWLYLFIVIISFYEICMRYIFNSPTDWVHETSIGLAAVCMLYGGLYSNAKKKHIRVPIIVDRFGDFGKEIFAFIANIITLLFTLMLCKASYSVVLDAFISPDGDIILERSGSSFNPVYPALLKGFMFIVLIFFVIQIVLHLYKNIQRIIELKKEESKNV